MKTAIRLFTSRRLTCAIVVAATAAAWQSFVPSAFAADMPVQARPVAVAPPLWTGFYFGAHGGGAWGSSRFVDPSFNNAFQPVYIKSSGAIAGAQLGADWQFGNIVVGGELDASWSSVSGEVPVDPLFGAPASGFRNKLRAMATGTGRVGYASGVWLGYVKAGVAWADIETTFTTQSPRPEVVPHHRTGVTAGAGVEVAFWRNLSAKVEYNALYFGPQSLSSSRFPMGPPNLDHLFHVVKGGINVRFGGDYLAARN
jgi:outer membrane immunogenic protein